jgi:hypothetical protein
MAPMKHNRIFLRIGLLSLVLLLGLLGGYRLTSATDNGPELYPSAICGHAGDIVVIEGINFTPNVLVEVTWAEMVLGTDPFPVQADPAGYLYFQFVVPNDIEGSHPLRVRDGQQVAEIIFNLGLDCPPPATATPVEPILTPTAIPTLAPPTMGPEVARLVCQPEGVQPNTLFQVSGENFQPGVSLYQFRWDGVDIPTSPVGLTVSDDGKFAASVIAPADSYEIHTLIVDDGHGGVASCYVNLIPRNPTPTSTATPTVTPSPTATWTPGPPPGVSLSPTPPPGPGDYCAAIEAAFTRYPLVNSEIDAGITVNNTNTAWPADQVEVRLWQYYNLFEWDTGLAQPLPALTPGETVPLHLKFVSPQSGPTWFQVRLHDIQSGAQLPCPSAWFPLQIIQADLYPPALLVPADDTWLGSRTLTLDWLPAGIPDQRAGQPEKYEVQLIDLGSGLLLYQATAAPLTEISHTLSADYGARQLAWRSRAYNAAGWGRWSTALYFGVDTVAPMVEMSLAGDPGGSADRTRRPALACKPPSYKSVKTAGLKLFPEAPRPSRLKGLLRSGLTAGMGRPTTAESPSCR